MSDHLAAYVGDRSGCLAYLSKQSGYYVYVLRRQNGLPFYVGKGFGPRIFHHENEARHPNDRRSNAHKLNVIRALRRANCELVYEISAVFADEFAAYEFEEALIRRYGRLHEGGPLTNRAPGGGSTSGASPYSKEKHAATLGGIPEDDPETAALNRFVLAIGTMNSVVLKPMSRFICKPTKIFPNSTRKPTLRQAIALAAAAAANGVVLRAGAMVPRVVCIDNVDGFVENGVSCDIATSGMANVLSATMPKDEQFQLSADQARQVIGLIGQVKASELGISEFVAVGSK